MTGKTIASDSYYKFPECVTLYVGTNLDKWRDAYKHHYPITHYHYSTTGHTWLVTDMHFYSPSMAAVKLKRIEIQNNQPVPHISR